MIANEEDDGLCILDLKSEAEDGDLVLVHRGDEISIEAFTGQEYLGVIRDTEGFNLTNFS